MTGHAPFGGPFDGPLWGILWAILNVAFWIAVIVLVASLVRRSGFRPGAPVSALRVLEERYARGEISRDEFLERRAVLRGERETGDHG